jgi:hypothetical protein
MKNQSQLNQYFGSEWSGNISNQKFSGLALIDKILPGEKVIDIGCGYNFFRGKIPHLVGIDPANDEADIKVSIEDFTTDDKFDVAFCLGSINFGEYEDIKTQVLKLNTLLTPTARIYWRTNPGLQDHDTDGCKSIIFFPWSEEWHHHFASMIGFTVTLVTWDVNIHTNKRSDRLYAEWVRNS